MKYTRKQPLRFVSIVLVMAAIALLTATAIWRGFPTHPVAEHQPPGAAAAPAHPPAVAPPVGPSHAPVGAYPAATPRTDADARRPVSCFEPQPATAEGVVAQSATTTDRYADAKVLDEKTGPVGPDGRYERVRIVLTDMKYPLVRVVGRFQVSGVLGQESEVLSSEAPAFTRHATPNTRHAPHDILLSQTAMVADHVTVKAREGVTEAALAAAVAADSGRILRKLRVPGPGVYLVQFPGAKVDTVPNALAALAKKTGAIATVEPDYVVHTCETIPNDPQFNELWGMKNTGQVPYSSGVITSSNCYSAIFMTFTPTTPTNGVSGLLYDCGHGATNDFPAGASGYIALIQRGAAASNETMTFAQKATNAKAAGAAAAIIYNNVSGDLKGSLGAPGDWIPTVGVADTVGAELLGLTNTSVTVMILPAPAPGDIRATAAWDNGAGSREILVGIIDTGIDYNHEDLKDNMWLNPGETGLDAQGRDRRNNGMDDDGNGFIDDWHGWDFCNDDNDPMDDHYHGTHCAGTIGAVGNNGVGVAGVCWKVSMVGLKFLNRSGSGVTSDAIEAVYYATRLGARLTSNSWGGGAFQQGLYDAITDAGNSNVLFVAAAGNDARNNDISPTYPSSYDCANIVAVAATDSGDRIAYFSCYGAATVDLGAPGVGVMSCQPGNKYQLLSGTSMATPHAAGACALAWSRAPYWNAAQIKSALLSAVDPLPSLAGYCVTGGRLNIAKLPADHVAVVDWSFDDTPGNNDGVANAGETINLAVTIENLSTNAATGVQASLTALTNATILTGQTNIGALAAGASVIGLFQVHLNAGVPPASPVRLQVAITDDAGGPWLFPLTVTPHISGQIAGTVTLDGAPAVGVQIVFSGPASNGVRTTDASGVFSFPVIEGGCSILATNSDWVPASRTITVTSSVSTVNLAFTTATISGTVRDAFTLATVAGATVAASGPFSQATLTDASGAYALSRVYGATSTVMVTATKGALTSIVRSITAPPNAPGTDFLLGAPEIHVQPTNLVVHASVPDLTNSALTISNQGSSDLKWRIRHTTDPIPGREDQAGLLDRSWGLTSNSIPGGAAFDGTALYVADVTYAGSSYGGKTLICKYDPLDGRVLGTLDVSSILPPPASLVGMTFYGTNLWIFGKTFKVSATYRLYEINPSNGQLIASFALPYVPEDDLPGGLAAGGGALWIIPFIFATNPDLIYKIDPENGSLLKTIHLGTSNTLNGLTYFNGALWTTFHPASGATVGDLSLYKINPEDGTIVGSLVDLPGVMNATWALTTDGKQHLWAMCQASTGSPDYIDPLHPCAAYQIDTGETDWLREMPDRGTTSPGGTQEVVTVCDSAIVGPGEYHADLTVDSNDLLEPKKHVDVTFVVSAPFSIAGHVTLDGVPLGNAVIRYSGPYSGSVLSGADGAYSIGAVTGSYTLVASKSNYLAGAPQTVAIGPSRSDVDFAFTTATISGTVRDRTSGVAVAGAAVSFTGAFTGAVQTAVNGAYVIERVYGQTGTVMLTASKTNEYVDSEPVTVTVPPSRLGVDFLMGNPLIAVTPAAFTSEVVAGQVVTQFLTIANTGSGTLRWSTWSTEDGTNGVGAVVRIQSWGAAVYDGTVLWSGNTKFDPNDGRVLGSLPPGTPSIMAWDGHNLWGAYGNADDGTYTVCAVDRDTGDIIKSFPAPNPGAGYDLKAIAFGEGSLWIKRYKSYSQGFYPPFNDRLYKMSPLDGAQQGWLDTDPGTTTVRNGFTNSTHDTLSLTYFAGALWTSSSSMNYGDRTATILKLSPVSGKVMSSFPSPHPTIHHVVALTSDGRSRLWITVMYNEGAPSYSFTGAVYLVTSGEVSWLHPSPDSGTVSASGSTNMAIAFDATGLAPGVYTAAVHVASNDRLHPDVTVPVALRVFNETMIDTDASSLSVPEGGTNTFRVRLAKRPPSPVTVNVARSGGDPDITVRSGATLAFDADNWDAYQTVVLAAVEDGDALNGSATILCSGVGMEGVPIAATEVENDTVLRLFAGVGGSVSPRAAVVTKGAAVPISAGADAGYSFVRWAVVDGSAQIADPRASNTTVEISAPTMIRAVFSGGATPQSDTLLWAWGYNGYGQLGDGTTSNRLSPVRVSGMSGVSAVSAGLTHTLALKNDGSVWAWGYNGYGQLGNGTNTNQSLPVQVTLTNGMPLSNAIAVSAGGYVSLALKNDGSVWACGYGLYVGDGTGLSRTRALQVQGLSNIVAIKAGMFTSYAVASNGTVWAWGSGSEGRLGDGITTAHNSLTPVPVKQVSGIAISNVIAISAGYHFALALKDDGSAWAWGGNNVGQLGDGTEVNRYAAVPVQGITNATGISAAYCSSFAFRTNDCVWSWGWNNSGQLGFGTYDLIRHSTPAPVPALSNLYARLEMGEMCAFGLKKDGTLWGWGLNNYGQLGDGTVMTRLNPVRVEGLTDVVSVTPGGYGPSYIGHTLALGYDLTADPAYGYEQWLKARFTTAQLNDLSLSGDTADPDLDGRNNEQEYRAGTDPMDALSCLVMYAPTNTPAAGGQFVLRWQSVAGKTYTVQAATNLLAGFDILVRTNIPATPTENVYTDNVGSALQKFYRVKVE